MKRFVLAAVLLCSVVLAYAYITNASAVKMPLDSIGRPEYRYLTYEPAHDADLIRICGDPGTETEDLDEETIVWGDTCTPAGFRIQAWNANNTYIWVENSNQDPNDDIDAYSSRPLIKSSNYLVEHGKCDDYNDGDSRWHPSFANYRINVVETGGDWILQWYDVVGCNPIKSVTLLTDSDPNTFSGGILDSLGWSFVHGLGNSEGNIDATGRYVALNGRDPHNGGDPTSSSRSNEMVVIDMGTTTSDPMSVSNAVDLCAYADWALVDPNIENWDPSLNADANGVLPCPGLASSGGSTAMTPDAEFVVVRYGSISGMDISGNYTRVFDYNPSNETISIQDLKGGDSEECACAVEGGICANPKRSKGFGPITDHADVTIYGEAPVVVSTKVSDCVGPSGFDQSALFTVNMWDVTDGTLYGDLMIHAQGFTEASARHVSGVGLNGIVYVSFFNSPSSDINPDNPLDPNVTVTNRVYDYECAGFVMANEATSDPNTADTVYRYVHHRDHAGFNAPYEFGDEDEAQCNARGDGLRQIYRGRWGLTGEYTSTYVVRNGNAGQGGSGGGGGFCGTCYSCICEE